MSLSLRWSRQLQRKVADRKRQKKSPLTARELEVAALVTEGLTNQQIADRLVLSTRTAEAHVENIPKKLGFSSRRSVASWFAQHDPKSGS
jgi:DNA-binding NarL/FixJ family response regulator